MTEPDPVAGHRDSHDESTGPLTLLFGHPLFAQAYVGMTAEENCPPKRLAEADLFSEGPPPPTPSPGA